MTLLCSWNYLLFKKNSNPSNEKTLSKKFFSKCTLTNFSKFMTRKSIDENNLSLHCHTFPFRIEWIKYLKYSKEMWEFYWFIRLCLLHIRNLINCSDIDCSSSFASEIPDREFVRRKRIKFCLSRCVVHVQHVCEVVGISSTIKVFQYQN